MKHILLSGLVLFGSASFAQAACYVHYKAKQEDPLKLHYGIAQVADAACNRDAANPILGARLTNQGWTLLNIVKVSPQAPTQEEQANAGEYFLRF